MAEEMSYLSGRSEKQLQVFSMQLEQRERASARQEEVNAEQWRALTEQLGMMQKQFITAEEKVRGKVPDMPKSTKLTVANDIEAYLTIFERTMEAYEIDQGQWDFN